MPESINVVAAVVRRGDRTLVCRRPEDKRHGGLWEFPGGKVHDGEGWLTATRREMSEELDVEVTHVAPPMFEARDPDSPFNIQFVETHVQGTPRAIEHSEIAWFTARELLDLDLAPADAQFVVWYVARSPGGASQAEPSRETEAS